MNYSFQNIKNQENNKNTMNLMNKNISMKASINQDPNRGRNTRQFGKDIINYQNAGQGPLNCKNPLKREISEGKTFVVKKDVQYPKKVKSSLMNSKLCLNEPKANPFSIEICQNSFFSTPMDMDDPVKTRYQHLQDRTDPQLVSEFYEEIKECLFTSEFDGTLYAIPNYIKRIQEDINEKFRTILLDWLVEVHLKFKLLRETLFVTINIIDRFLSIVPTNRDELQCVGVASMLIACKYEEIYYPDLEEFKEVTDNSCSVQQIIRKEFEILSALKFDLTVPSSLRFYEIFNHFLKLKEKDAMATMYLLEMSLLDYGMIKYKPSLIATGCMMLIVSGNYMKKETLYLCCKHSMEDITDVCKDILAVYQKVDQGKMQSLKRKYSSSKFMEVAKYDILSCLTKSF